MNIAELKKLNDKDFIKYISDMKRHKSTFCMRCGCIIMPNKRRILNVTRDTIKVRKLCTLCEECYIDMLDYLGISDVEL